MKCDKWTNALDLDYDFIKSISDTVNKCSGLRYMLYASIYYDPVNFCYVFTLHDPTIDFTFKQFLFNESFEPLAVHPLQRIQLLNDIAKGFIEMLNLMNFYDAEV